MRSRPQPRKFSSGELAPWLDGITTVLTQQGCRTLENFIVKKQGQAVRRPGTFFVDEVKDSTKATALVPVTIDDTDIYVLELGDAYIRFYKNHVRVTYPSTVTIYEVTSPWSTGDLASLAVKYIPNEKALYLGHANYDLRRLTWTSDASWSLDSSPILAGGPLVTIDIGLRVRHTDDLTNWVADSDWNTTSGLTPRLIVNKGTYIFVSTSTLGIMRSEDLFNWVSVTPSTLSQGYDIIRDKYNGIYAVGQSSLSGTLVTSTDNGSTWTQLTTTTGVTRWQAIGYDPDNEQFKVGGQSAAMYSSDGATWTSLALAATDPDTWYNIRYGNSLWVAVGTRAATSGQIWTSGSGAGPWTRRVTGAGAVKALDHGTYAGVSLWVAVVEGGAVLYSQTGTVWTTGTSFAQTVDTVFAAKDAMYAFGTNFFWSSRDGVTWQTHTIYATLPVTSYQIYTATYDLREDIEWFNVSGHFPSVLSSHEGRLIMAGFTSKPSTITGSATNRPHIFQIGDLADQSFTYDLTSERNVDIQWMMGDVGGIVVGTRTAEGIMVGSPSEGITPLTAQFRWISTFGSNSVQPVRIHDTIAFVQRGGEIVRGYEPGINGQQSLELTIYADHIGKGGIIKLDHQDDPQSILYALRNDGQLLALTFNNARRARYGLSPQVLELTAEEDTRAWSRIKAAPSLSGTAVIESVAIIPTTGAEDEIWLIVKRTIGGSTKRYVEYMDTLAVASFAAAHYVDCGVYATSGTTFQTVGSLTHLAGENVDALLDGTRWLAGLTVAASGTITTAPYSGTAIHVGLPYTSYLQTMRGDYGSPLGSGAGLNKRTSNLIAWVHDSSALAKFGPSTTACGAAGEAITYSTSTALATEVVLYPFPGQWDRDNYIWCVVTDPKPFTLVAILPDSETGDR